jgi:membrane protease YdiL (CAAX protease family)
MTINLGIACDLGDRRILQPGKWRPLRSLVWMVVLTFAIVLAFGPAVEALGHALPKAPAWQFGAKACGVLIVLGAYALLVRLGEDRNPSELFLSAAPAGLLAGLTIGVVIFAATMAILSGAGLYDIAWHCPAPAWRGVGLALESGVLEEVIVRGVILRLVWRAFGPLAAFVVSGLLFGLGHIANPGATLFTTACVAIEAGVMLGAFYALTGRLWVSIGVHAGWNFTQGTLFGAHVSGSDFGPSFASSTARGTFPDWLTGGAFGPEASVPAFVVCSLVGVGVLWTAWRQQRFAPPDV